MSKLFLIGDTHFNHKGISNKFRHHFSSDLEHDETIHNNILSVRGSSHQLYLLGDIFFHPDGFSKLADYAKAFQNVHIVLGNHDHQHVFLYATKFKNVKVAGLLNKYGCWLSHAPIHPQELYRGLNVHGHCVDTDTEILTTEGWRKYEDIHIGDKIISVDPLNHKIAVEDLVLDKFKYKYKGKMLEVDKRSFSMRVTDGHRVPHISPSGKLVVKEAKDIIEGSVLRLICSSQGPQQGVDLENHILKLYIAIAADANITPAKLVRFIFSKIRKFKYICKLLDEAGIDYKTGENSNGNYIHFRLPRELEDWNIKGLDTRLSNCTKVQAEIIRDVYRNTDGNRNLIFTSKDSEKDILSILFIKNGYKVTIHTRVHGFGKKPSHSISVTENKLTRYVSDFKNNCKLVDVDEDVWCVRTNTGFWFAKRKGSVYLTGNCHSKVVPDDRYICVSCEQTNYIPRSLESIQDEFRTKGVMKDAKV